MKSLIRFFSKKYVYGIFAAIILISSFTYTLLDAFIIERTYDTSQANTSSVQTKDNNQSAEEATTEKDITSENAAVTSNSYKNENVSIKIEKVEKNNVVFYVADVILSDVSYLKTAFAKGTYGKNITEYTSQMAEDNNAVFAINGDYYGFRDNGLVIRNSTLYRDVARNSPYNEALAICADGQLKIIKEGEKTGEEYLKDGIVQTFSFGPTLVENGKAVDSNILREKSSVSTSSNPRTAIGQIAPLHYIFIVVDGRTQASRGMSLSDLAQELEDRGCTVAYNLDGGGSSTMYFNGEVINNPTDGRHDGERKISDIIYIDGSGN